MTQKTKLEIIGPYTPEHEGPFAWILGYPKKCLVHSIVEGVAFITADGQDKPFLTNVCFIRNACEVPVAREFWVNEYAGKDGLFHNIFENEATANRHKADTFLRTIHVREVLPGEGA